MNNSFLFNILFFLFFYLSLSNSIEYFGSDRLEIDNLYQINKHSIDHPLIVAIDFGNSNCGISYLTTHKQSIIIPDIDGNLSLPSYVSFINNTILVGEEAKNLVFSNGNNTIFNLKHLIGKKFSKIEDIDKLPFKIISDNLDNPKISVTVNGTEKLYSPEEILSFIFNKLKRNSETYLGVPVTKTIIICPSYFDSFQREALKDAATKAGFESVFRIFDETKAIELEFNRRLEFDSSIDRYHLVLKMGGDSFEASLVSVDRTYYENFKEYPIEILEAESIRIGGDDFTESIVKYLLDVFKSKSGLDASFDMLTMEKLKSASEKAKIELSFSNSTIIQFNDFFGGFNLNETLSRSKFEDLNNHLYPKFIQLISKLMNDSFLKTQEIHSVLMTGGSTTMPKIRSIVKEYFNGRESLNHPRPSSVISIGASLLTSILTSGFNDYPFCELYYEFPKQPIGVEIKGGLMSTVIGKYSFIPSRRIKQFSTTVDYQEKIEIKILQGDSQLSQNNTEIGTIELSGISPAPRGVPIQVVFELCANLDLEVKITDLSNGITNSTVIPIENDYGQFDFQDHYEFEDEQVERIKLFNSLKDYINSVKCMLEINQDNYFSEVKENIFKIISSMPDNVTLFQSSINEIHSILDPIISSIYSKIDFEMTRNNSVDIMSVKILHQPTFNFVNQSLVTSIDEMDTKVKINKYRQPTNVDFVQFPQIEIIDEYNHRFPYIYLYNEEIQLSDKIDYIPFSLGIGTERGDFIQVIPKDLKLPIQRSEIITITSDYESVISIPIYEGDPELHSDSNNHLGTLYLGGIYPAPKGISKIQVIFDININGSFTIFAIDLGSRISASLDILEYKEHLNNGYINVASQFFERVKIGKNLREHLNYLLELVNPNQQSDKLFDILAEIEWLDDNLFSETFELIKQKITRFNQKLENLHYKIKGNTRLIVIHESTRGRTNRQPSFFCTFYNIYVDMEPFITFDDIRLQFNKNHNQFRPNNIVYEDDDNTLHNFDPIEHLRIEDQDEDNDNEEYSNEREEEELEEEEQEEDSNTSSSSTNNPLVRSSTLLEHDHIDNNNDDNMENIHSTTSTYRNSLSRRSKSLNLDDLDLEDHDVYSNNNNNENKDVQNNNNNSVNVDNSDDNESDSNSTSTTTTSTSTTTNTSPITNLIRDTTDNDEEEMRTMDEKVDEFVSLIIHEPHTGLIIYDNYGFLVEQDMVQIHLIYKDKFVRQEKQRKQQWLDFIEANPGAFHLLSLSQSPMASATTTYRRSEPPKPLKDMIRRGVPTDFRSSVWLRCSGAYLRLAANPDEYYNILKVYHGKQSVATKQIAMDIDRTFPDHKYLNTQEHMETLSRVLTAYSWRNPKVGYCQCMNFIVGYLLLHMSEHEAYWTLVSIIEDILPSEYFTSTMIDLSVDVRFVFDEILQKKLPKLHKHFTTLNLSLPLIMTQWFLCIMATATPTETTFRIWDVFFAEGSKVLFRFAVALFKMNEEKLLTCKDYNTLYNLIRKIPSMMYDADALIEYAFNKIGSLSMKLIDQKRKESKVIVFNEYIEFQMMRNGIRKDQNNSNKNNNNNSNQHSPKKSPTLLSKKKTTTHKEA
ncbi:hypothetical protein PPL_08211 [Heterostelium album PN500]|uniref:Rab-GAP TBC domain-containing protein n=1 Tax=Heterostelium pallidum (strain ATCC 26659 / Pp 5 / PN500) TaxID=670386 RepID=D3BIX6_HETP5|nr:hypothetical protein PPL_08211 [Heterostelium album PN500]EFA78750.1 hypothetical protein PPL_08211 [Heterostelium album PN500]|eukprot:XP_020430874.1 hypothetical protein PPL_08211 [Heterostelium album PN500]